VHLKRGVKRASFYLGCSRATSVLGLFLLGNFVPPTRFGATNVQVKIESLRGEKAWSMKMRISPYITTMLPTTTLFFMPTFYVKLKPGLFH